jgi:hypothetical protein
MRTGFVRSDIAYARNLVGAGLDGVSSAWKETGSHAFAPALTGAVWGPIAIGAAAGILTACLNRKRRSGFIVAMGGVVGSALGLGAGVAYVSRGVTGAVARGAMRKVNTVRDARWLEKNPIAYA